MTKTIKRDNRRKMNRISSLRHKHRNAEDLFSSAKSTELIQSSLDRLTCDLDHGRYTDEDLASHEEEGRVVINEVREYKQQEPINREGNMNLGNHGTLKHRCSKQNDMVQGDYSPNKSTLGLELVASPSLLQQVLTPSNSVMTDVPSGESAGESTLSSTGSLHKEMGRAKSFDRFVDKTNQIGKINEGRVEGENKEEQDEGDYIVDDESAYSAMETVAETVVSIRSARSKNVIKESSSQEEEMAASQIAATALAATVAAATQNHTSKPITLRPTYSMKSVKSSEGMEVGQFLNANFDEANQSQSSRSKFSSQPFDESDAKMIASSRASAVVTTAAGASEAKPFSCLRPSSFPSGQNLVSPGLIQNARVNRSMRMAKFRSTFEKRPIAEDTIRSVAITQVERKKELTKESNPCFSAPAVSFAENLDENHQVDEIKTIETTAISHVEFKDESGLQSPTSVNEFFPDSVPTPAQHYKDVASSATRSNRERNSSMTNRLARDRQALKSIALAKGSVRAARKKSKAAQEKETKAFSSAEQEVTAPFVVQSVSDLGIPQFSPTQKTEEGKVTEAAEVGEVKKIENKPLDSQEDDDDIGPSVEVDATVILNTSDESINTKKRRFLLPRLRRKARENKSTALKSSNAFTISSNQNRDSSRNSIKSKFFGSKKKDIGTKTKKTQKSAEELEKIKEVEKYTAWLAPTTQPAHEEFPMNEAPSPIKDEPVHGNVKLTRKSASELKINNHDTTNPVPSNDIAQSLQEEVVGSTTAAIASSTTGSTASQKVDEPTITVVTKPTEDTDEILTIETEVPPPFIMADDAQNSKSASANSKPSLNSKVSKSPTRASSELETAELPPRAKNMDTNDGAAPLQSNDTRVASSCSGSQSLLNNFADFGAASIEKDEADLVHEALADVKNSSFEDDMADAQVQQAFSEFGSPHFVGGDVSGEVEHGVEVEWGVSLMGPNEFGDEGIALDTSAVVAELDRNLSEPKWENDTKVGIDEASIKSGCTKSSSLSPRKLFQKRDKDREEHQKLEEEEADAEEDESISVFKHLPASKKRSPHPAEKRTSYNVRRGKDDSRSFDDDSDDYSSDGYSSDEREDVVGVIATSLHKGFTGIVDMMETAFAFNKEDEETLDYGSEPSESESEDDEDSYIQRKLARRRDKQRRLLREARRSSRRKQRERKEILRLTRSARLKRSPDNGSVISEEEPIRQSQRHTAYSRKYASSGRASSSRRRKEHPRYEY